jgi:hypothetical protein
MAFTCHRDTNYGGSTAQVVGKRKHESMFWSGSSESNSGGPLGVTSDPLVNIRAVTIILRHFSVQGFESRE